MRALTIGVYAVLALTAVVSTMLAHWRPDSFAGLGAVLDRAFASRPARIVILLFWLWLGWHVFVGETVTP